MKIAVIVPTYNEEDIIEHTLKYLLGQDVEVHLLDNESTDRTVQIAKTLQVHVSSFSSDGLFHEKIYNEAIRSLISLIDADWIMKNDADEFIESPWTDIGLKEGIEFVDSLGYDCIGVRSYVFAPMPEEKPHEPFSDARNYYDYCFLWDKVDRWSPEIHPKHNEMWKINILKARGGVTIEDSHKLRIPKDLEMHLFPELFMLRHYVYRDPKRTYQRLVKERRDRMAPYNIEHNVCNHYVKYSDDSEYVETGFTFDRLRKKCLRWSELKKNNYLLNNMKK